MSRPPKPTPAQERERRARIALAGLAVVLAVICAIQAPRLLRHASAAPAAEAAVGPAAPAGASSLTAAAVAVAPAPHLHRLRGFAWKDPFRQQLQPAVGAPKAPPTKQAPIRQAAQPETAATMRTPPAVAESAPPSQVQALKPLPAKPAVIGKPGVLVLLDGRRLGLLPGDLFPAADPVFRLVSFTKKTARIALVTGTLGDGSAKLQLEVGRRLVLRDATTGKTYALVLVRPTRVLPSTAKAPKA